MPVNLVPVSVANGISAGYLRPADGLVSLADGPGSTRGAINWNGVAYRVMGTKLCSIDASGAITQLGDVGGSGHVVMVYSFDLLAIWSNGNLFYWDGSAITQVTDPDLGTVVHGCWVDGYFMSTDGEFLIVTELADPYSVDPLKYGSSEIDPDPVVALLKLRNEVNAVNRYTIEVFDNVGGTAFPFQRIKGAQVQKGAVGTYACCVFAETIAFVGSGRNEAPGVYLALNAEATKVSTREIDLILGSLTEHELSIIVVESKIGTDQQQLWVHLLDRTLVYDFKASRVAGAPVWFTLTSGDVGFSQHPAQDLCWCYDKWLVGNPSGTQAGFLSQTSASQWGTNARWEATTTILYNESKGAQFHSLELVCLTGRLPVGTSPQISTSYSIDGETWSQERFIGIGGTGNRTKRLVWFRQGYMRNWRIQRFRGDSSAFISITRLEAQLEPLGA